MLYSLKNELLQAWYHTENKTMGSDNDNGKWYKYSTCA